MIADRVDISIARQYPRKARRLRLLIALSSLLLVMGLLSPIITLEKFVVIENTFSVLSGVIQLLKEGQWFLFLVISAFSIVLPVLKLGVLYLLVGSRVPDKRHLHRYLHWMHLYGKWSMLDVFVVAILVVAVKLGAIANVEMRYGLYAFAASVLITMYVTARVVILTGSDEMRNGGQ
jgi:paraquat-inducible protein A